ncbi:MAG: hypothetical protein HQM13_20700 [SAR324 cluster bacterium]|nr:hypothetical protein [SAR324 cluster bacterium]
MSARMIVTFSLIMICVSPLWAAPHSHQSAYAGQEKRKIKTLSAQDLDALQKGEGWGLAKAAELNGVPGPAHLLEMKNEIQLTDSQVQQIEMLFQEMKQQAISAGLVFVHLEQELNQMFAEKSVNEEKLLEKLGQIAEARQQLRFVHLKAHLKTTDILSQHQIEQYNRLRGYTDDPCKNPPKGHDLTMWKQHNQCE